MLIEIHMLTNYPPTNLNRDETGAPKTCIFSGVNHGRISSQCLKRSWRTSAVFQDAVGPENLGIRTRLMPQMVTDILIQERGIPEEWRDAIEEKLTDVLKGDKKTHRTKQIVFYAPSDLRAVADIMQELLSNCKDAKAIAKIKEKTITDALRGTRPITVDIALFGRMVTADEFADVDASMQVAHAISTNRVTSESDFFTAMDDLLSGNTLDESGSAMMGDTDYNSSCYYIYAAIDVDALRENLSETEDGDVIANKAVAALLEAMAVTNPSGKQNSFAGHALPSAVMVQCKDRKIPVSLVNAFSKPAHPNGSEDLVANSIRKLVEECNEIDKGYEIPIQNRFWFTVKGDNSNVPGNATVMESYPKLVNAVSEVLTSQA